MGNHLKPFTKDIDKCIQDKCNIVDQGILLWNIIHAYIYEMQKNMMNGILLGMKI
jgi:hypothetical protein